MSVKTIIAVCCDNCGKELTGKMLARFFPKIKAHICLDCLESADKVNASGEVVAPVRTRLMLANLAYEQTEERQEPTTNPTPHLQIAVPAKPGELYQVTVTDDAGVKTYHAGETLVKAISQIKDFKFFNEAESKQIDQILETIFTPGT